MIKYCFSNRHPLEMLSLADEIFVNYKDREEVENLFTDYPKAIIILDVPYYETIDINYFILLNEKGKIVFRLNDLNLVNSFKINKLKFYLNFKARSFYELNAIVDMGVSYIEPEAPIFFNWDQIMSYNIPTRVTPQSANSGLLTNSYQDGVFGSWIRPEDLVLYDPCVVDFSDETSERAETLYRIYEIEKEWSGPLKFIVHDLKHEAYNRLIYNDLSQKRISCNQVCQGGGKCRLCKTMLDLAEVALSKKEQIIKKEKS